MAHPILGPWAPLGSRPHIPPQLKQPVPPFPGSGVPPRQSRWAVGARGIAGPEADAATVAPVHNWDPAAWGGRLHKDNLVPKLSPEVSCLDLGTVNKFHFFFPMFCQANEIRHSVCELSKDVFFLPA